MPVRFLLNKAALVNSQHSELHSLKKFHKTSLSPAAIKQKHSTQPAFTPSSFTFRSFWAQAAACCSPLDSGIIYTLSLCVLSDHLYLGWWGAASHLGRTSLWRPSPDSEPASWAKAHEPRRLSPARPGWGRLGGEAGPLLPGSTVCRGPAGRLLGPTTPADNPLMPVTMRFDWRLEHWD